MVGASAPGRWDLYALRPRTLADYELSLLVVLFLILLFCFMCLFNGLR